MQPKQLELQNFGPFIHERIDFSKLEDVPLFLISGKTGAGKTTIFDGMSYALFGETSGKLREGKEMRSLFATPTDETVVTFTFEHQGFIYQIQRKPEQFLAKKRGEGQRKQAAKVQLTIYDEQHKEKKQFTKQNEVNVEIQELLHLDKEQFLQIVLLPQGEFRNFLVSSSNDKETILRNLFGTAIFKKMNEQLKEQTKEHEKQLNQYEEKMAIIQQNYAYFNEPSVDHDSLTYEEQFDLWAADQAALDEQITQFTEEIAQLRVTQKIVEENYYQAKTQNEQLEELAVQKEKLEKLKEKAEQIAELEEVITNYSFVEKVQPRTKQLEELLHAQITYTDKLKEQSEVILETKNEYETWQKNETLRMNQRTKLEELQLAIQTEKAQLPDVEQKEKLEEKNKQTKQKLQELESAVQEYEQKVVTYVQQQAVLEKTLAQKENVQKDKLALIVVMNEKEKWEETTTKVQLMAQSQEKNQARDQVLTEEIKSLSKQVLNQEEKNRQLKSEWAALQITRLQVLLIDGQACPVCGATEHPLQQHSGEVAGVDQIKKIERDLEESEKELEHLRMSLVKQKTEQEKLCEQIESEKEQYNTLVLQLDEKQQTLRKAIVDAFPKSYEEKQPLSEMIAHITDDLDKQHEKIEKAQQQEAELEMKKQQVDKQLIDAQERYQDVLDKSKQEQTLLAHLKVQVGERTLSEIQAWVNQHQVEYNESKQNLDAELKHGQTVENKLERVQAEKKQKQEQLEETIKKIEEINDQIHSLLKKQKYFTSLLEINQFFIDYPNIEKTKQEVKAFQDERMIVTSKITQLEELGLPKQKHDLDALNEQINQQNQVIIEKQERCTQLKEQAKNNQRTSDHYQEIYQSAQQKLENLSELKQLSQTMNGENLRKTSLERYVLQIYLEEVLQVANERLQRLTKNRYQFELADKVGSSRKQTGLEINIYDDEAGTSRRAQTLSGGESFIAALALALGLAEVIQIQSGGVSIDALFIDEGFGSLDEEALEMAMEALETIENEGRMIGIISHVKELKERIPQQIQIHTNGSGQSKVHYQLL